ncbi:hypothetical protein B0H13DRAFT_1854871 [Mycena leptocephala]|nr:hypothetical protein B0H13DRAFT_1854871 [Mycena leptocephala]
MTGIAGKWSAIRGIRVRGVNIMDFFRLVRQGRRLQFELKRPTTRERSGSVKLFFIATSPEQILLVRAKHIRAVLVELARSLNLAVRAWRAWLAAWLGLCSLITKPLHLSDESDLCLSEWRPGKHTPTRLDKLCTSAKIESDRILGNLRQRWYSKPTGCIFPKAIVKPTPKSRPAKKGLDFLRAEWLESAQVHAGLILLEYCLGFSILNTLDF